MLPAGKPAQVLSQVTEIGLQLAGSPLFLKLIEFGVDSVKQGKVPTGEDFQKLLLQFFMGR